MDFGGIWPVHQQTKYFEEDFAPPGGLDIDGIVVLLLVTFFAVFDSSLLLHLPCIDHMGQLNEIKAGN